jgi:outer membrane immunogenic protein
MNKLQRALIALTATVAVGTAGRAVAAERPHIWTGAYGGVNAGYAWGRQSADWSGDTDTLGGAGNALLNTALKDDLSFAPISRATAIRSQGAMGGGQLGYNLQFGSWVAGIETDIQFSALDGDFSRSGVADIFIATFEHTAALKQSVDWFGTLRGRLGYLATDKLLIFGTAGLAYGRTELSGSVTNDVNGSTSYGASTTIVCAVANGTCLGGSDAKVSTGWAAGFGVEWAWRRDTTIKFEYLHIDLGDQSIRLTPLAPSSGTGYATVNSSNAFDLLRAAVNVRF